MKYIFLMLSLLIIAGCKKQNTPAPASSGYEITLASGLKDTAAVNVVAVDSEYVLTIAANGVFSLQMQGYCKTDTGLFEVSGGQYYTGDPIFSIVSGVVHIEKEGVGNFYFFENSSIQNGVMVGGGEISGEIGKR